jgi:hypothetical protein
MFERTTMRALPLVNRMADAAPVAPACCNACRTCMTTNIAGVLAAGVTGLVSLGARLLGRRRSSGERATA